MEYLISCLNADIHIIGKHIFIQLWKVYNLLGMSLIIKLFSIFPFQSRNIVKVKTIACLGNVLCKTFRQATANLLTINKMHLDIIEFWSLPWEATLMVSENVCSIIINISVINKYTSIITKCSIWKCWVLALKWFLRNIPQHRVESAPFLVQKQN